MGIELVIEVSPDHLKKQNQAELDALKKASKSTGLPAILYSLSENLAETHDVIEKEANNKEIKFDAKDEAEISRGDSYQITKNLPPSGITVEKARQALYQEGVKDQQQADFIIALLLQNRIGYPIVSMKSLIGLTVTLHQTPATINTADFWSSCSVDKDNNVLILCKSNIEQGFGDQKAIIGQALSVIKVTPDRKVSIENLSLHYTDPVAAKEAKQALEDAGVGLKRESLFTNPRQFIKKHPGRTAAITVGAIGTVLLLTTGTGLVLAGVGMATGIILDRFFPNTAHKINRKITNYINPLSHPETPTYFIKPTKPQPSVVPIKKPEQKAEKRAPAIKPLGKAQVLAKRLDSAALYLEKVLDTVKVALNISELKEEKQRLHIQEKDDIGRVQKLTNVK